VLDPDGSHGRQIVEVDLPPSRAPTPMPATYSISSLPLGALDVDQPHSISAAPVQVFAIGGGPRAVRPMTVGMAEPEQIRFPLTVTRAALRWTKPLSPTLAAWQGPPSGAVALDRVNFNRATSGARYSYVAESEFSRARAQVQQLRRSGSSTQFVPVFTDPRSNLSVGPQSGNWAGTLPGNSALSRGLHRLQVTAWLTTDDRSWVFAVAPNLVVQ
jgi:hypothetical protein